MEDIRENKNIDIDNEVKKKQKGGRFSMLRASLVLLLAFTVICGIIYPIAVTITANTLFPYEANGSVIEVTLADGTKRVFGSELIGQSYEEPRYMFGRVNSGAPSNLSPESVEYEALVLERVAERKAKLASIGYTENESIPDELLTSSGSGVDPHISVETAYFQIPVIVAARTKEGAVLTENDVKEIVDKYTEGRFLGIFGTKRVNVLLVNLALDGVL